MRKPSDNKHHDIPEDGKDHQGGAKSVFRSLFQAQHEKLVKFLTARLGDEHEAQDVAHEAYVRLLDLSNDKVINHHRAYLYRTAANIAVDRLRKAQRQRLVSDSWKDDHENVASEEPVADQVLISRETLGVLGKAIAELPPRCRYAFLEYRIKGRSYAEIAEDLSVSESMIRKYVLKALRYCRAAIDAES